MNSTHIRNEVGRLLSLVRSGEIGDTWARHFIGDMHDRIVLDRPISPANAEKIVELAGRY